MQVPGFGVFQQVVTERERFGAQKLVELEQLGFSGGIEPGAVALKRFKRFIVQHAVLGRCVAGQNHGGHPAKQRLVRQRSVAQCRQLGLHVAG